MGSIQREGKKKEIKHHAPTLTTMTLFPNLFPFSAHFQFFVAHPDQGVQKESPSNDVDRKEIVGEKRKRKKLEKEEGE